MSDERIEVQRTIPASAETIFAVLCDPRGHVEIDSSGMLQSATGDPVRASGDTFVVHMDRESLGDLPMGRYDVQVTIGEFEPARAISWTIIGTLRPPVGHRYGYRLEPVDGGSGAGACRPRAVRTVADEPLARRSSASRSSRTSSSVSGRPAAGTTRSRPPRRGRRRSWVGCTARTVRRAG